MRGLIRKYILRRRMKGLLPIPTREEVRERINEITRWAVERFEAEILAENPERERKTARPPKRRSCCVFEKYLNEVRNHDLKSSRTIERIQGIDDEPNTEIRPIERGDV